MSFYIGQIVLFACGSIARGFMPCHGQVLPMARYSTLFAVIGGQYGGDYRTTFGLPDTSTMPVVEGFHYAICVEGDFPTRPR